MNKQSAFKQTMRKAGIEPLAEIIPDGSIHRFNVSGDKPRSENGWYVFHNGDPAAGAFGCWKRGISETWSDKEYRTLTAEEKARYSTHIECIRKQREEEQSRVHAECRKASKVLWDNGQDVDANYPYIVTKGIKPAGIKQLNDMLLIPVRDYAGTLHGLQFISTDGSKRFKTGTSKAGNFCLIPGDKTGPVLICEGYATGASLNEATGHIVAVAFDAGNLRAVAKKLRETTPNRALIVCADNDQWTEGNPGLTKAIEAARKTGAFLALPVFRDTTARPTDFNDLHKIEGIEAVRGCIKAAEMPLPPPPEGIKSRQPTQAEILLSIAEVELQLFHDQNREPFCYFQNQTFPLKSNRVKESLAYQFYAQTGKAPNSDALNQAINVLKGKSLFENPQIELYNRIAVADNFVWYDMGDGTAIRTTAGMWEHIGKVPPLFRRYSHQKAQLNPSRSGDPWRVFNYLNVDKEHQLLVLVYIVSCFIPSISHPIFHPHGPQGSGKTTFCRVLKDLIDPSSLSTLIMQRDYAQLIQAIAHHHFVPFDNLSDLPGWASDILAIACTGGGLSKRQLYTDEDDIVLSVRRCIGINAINLLISRADLMDRSILLHLERIDPLTRRDETEFWEDFEQQKAGILGGLFNVLSKALSVYPSVKLQRLPRMADFAKYGYAIGETLQSGGGADFLKAYENNIKRQNEEIIQSNTLILAVLKEMNQKTEWSGTVKHIYSQLYEIAQPDKRDPTFPKNERSLRKHLERAKTTLIQQGIKFTIGERTADGIPLTFNRSDFQEDTATSTFDTSGTQSHGENVDDEANVDNFGSCWNDPTGPIDLTGKDVEVIE